MSRRLLAILAPLMALGSPALAHNPDIATFIVREAEEGAWVMEVSVSAAGLHHALQERAGEGLGELSVPDYRALALEEIREGVSLVVDGEPVALGEGEVRLGNHASTLRFALPDVDGVSELQGTRLSALSAVPNQHNVLRLVEEEGALRQWVLAERSAFTLSEAVPEKRSGSP